MKNLTKWFTSLFLGLGLLSLASPAHAGWYKGAPKEIFVSSYTTGAVQISPSVSTNTVILNPNAAFQPGAVYQIQLSSGAASEFMILVDSQGCAGITASMAPGTVPAQTYTTLTPHMLFSSTTANTVYTFDPPIRFDQGLCAIDSAATGQYGVVYELGRGVSGQ
jgi:hypothetical protein